MMPTITTVIGIVGLLVISIAVWIRDEKRQDILFAVGGICMLIYSISIGSIIFTILQIIFIASALVEIVQRRQ